MHKKGLWYSSFFFLQDELKQQQQAALQKGLQDASEEERQRILSQYEEDMHTLDNKVEEQRGRQRDALLAKLAARKRMREELTKENGVSSELDRITKAQVCGKYINNL